ncbi:PH domain-containing protein [Halobellus rarus]|uniref:PH domain-containing protein n=1 Tax=Halobellus rarus TaxID=1126237 RepID=A0ABD6CQ55_9EURY
MTLDASETVAWDGQPKLTTALPGVGMGIALLVGAAWLVTVQNESVVGILLGIAGVTVGLWAYLSVVNTEYVLSDRAVYTKQGVIGIRITESSLSKIQNSAFSQDALGSVFGYGTVTLEIAGGDDIQLRRIEEPETVRRLVDHATGEETPGSLEQWRAVLDEVRALRRAVESQAS